MAKGKLNIQAADGAVIGLVVPDGLTSGERQISLGVNLSGITAYHLLQGNLAVSNSTITQGFNTTLFTGNGTTQAVNTGIDMDTQWGNTIEEKFGGLVWLKSRSTTDYHLLHDTVRGVGMYLSTNTTSVPANGSTQITSIVNNGFNTGSAFPSGMQMYSANFQTTHRVSGTTNHGKAYTCHYNPFTGFTMVKYEGSGIAGHEIPHHLGRKLGFTTIKNLSVAENWIAQYEAATIGLLNLTNAFSTNTNGITNFGENSIALGTSTGLNTSTNQYVMHGWANSYFDKSNKLIGNYELVPYQGTGVAGNKVKTKGKPAWVMIKRTDVAGYWATYDNQRTPDKYLLVNMSDQESNTQTLGTFDSNGFTIKNTVWSDLNAAGGQYIALVAYDTNSNGGGSYYPLAGDTATVQINNALIPLAQGIDGNGAKNTILNKNETITGLTYTQGKNYVYCDKNGSYGVTPYKPRYLESELVRTFAGESPDYYDIEKNKWFNTDAGAELVTNGYGSSTTGWSSNNATLSVTDGIIIATNTATNGFIYQYITTVAGRKYKLKLHSLSGNATPTIQVRDNGFNGNIIATDSGFKIYDITFIANSTTTALVFVGVGASGTVTRYDNISVFPAEITPTTEITNSRNYLNHIVYADNDGGVLYVEELPKIEYKDIVKANEFKGKNACTAWVNFDGTTTPPTIRDSYNVSAVIRTATGYFDCYFKEPMDTTTYTGFVSYTWQGNVASSGSFDGGSIYKFQVRHSENGAFANSSINTVLITGGKN